MQLLAGACVQQGVAAASLQLLTQNDCMQRAHSNLGSRAQRERPWHAQAATKRRRTHAHARPARPCRTLPSCRGRWTCRPTRRRRCWADTWACLTWSRPACWTWTWTRSRVSAFRWAAWDHSRGVRTGLCIVCLLHAAQGRPAAASFCDCRPSLRSARTALRTRPASADTRPQASWRRRPTRATRRWSRRCSATPTR